MSKLDLKTRIGIRDFWDSPNGKLQPELEALKDLLGAPVDINPEWQSIQGDLAPIVDDKQRVVEIAAAVAADWCNVFAKLLGENKHSAWADQVTDKVAKRGRLLVAVDVSDDQVAKTKFREPNQFVLELPRVEFVSRCFKNEHEEALLDLFKPKSAPVPPSANAPPDDWAEIDQTGTVIEPAPAVSAVAAATGPRLPSPAMVPDYLPSLDALPRPQKLMAAPPYHLMIIGSGSRVEVHGSHGPTLELFEGYLKKWCATDPNRSDRAPLFEIEMGHPVWGVGGHDRLIIKRDNRYSDVSLAVPIFLSLAEKFGYALLKVEGSCWIYRRDKPIQGR